MIQPNAVSHEHPRTLYIEGLPEPVPATHAVADGLIDGYEAQGHSFGFAEGVEAAPVVSPGFATPITYGVFNEVGLGSPKMMNTVPRLRRLGVFTFAELGALGLSDVSEQAYLSHFRQTDLRQAFEWITGKALSDERSHGVVALGNYYNDLRDASPAVLLTAGSSSPADIKRHKYEYSDSPYPNKTLGGLVSSYQPGGFLDVIYRAEAAEGQRPTARQLGWRDFVVQHVLPVVADFDRQIRYPRLRAARASIAQALTDAAN